MASADLPRSKIDVVSPTPADARRDNAAVSSSHVSHVHLTDVDLRIDPQAAVYVKDEVVSVVFATHSGALLSLEGPNAYQVNDALIEAATGERWVVSRARFDPKYVPADPVLIHGADGAYRNLPTPVLARRMDAPFTIARSAGGDCLQGGAGDWLLQYAPSDYGVVQQARFARVYRPVSVSLSPDPSGIVVNDAQPPREGDCGSAT